MAKLLISYEDLYRLYVDDGKSFKEIAFIYKCSNQTICNRLKEYNIQARDTYSHFVGTKQSDEHKSKRALKLTGVKRPGIGGRKSGFVSPIKGMSKFLNPDIITNGLAKDKHWNWKGGISKENILIRQSSEYKNWRQSVFIRDNWICQNCFLKKRQIEAHHIEHFAMNISARFNLNNGITLCKSCHSQFHKKVLNNVSQ